MRLITWNIQWAKGCDGIVDPGRIARDVADMGGADILCFQEVSSHFDKLDGGADQERIFSDLFPRHMPVFRPAVERHEANGVVRRFGNMTLSRFPVRQVSNHLLPWPQAASVRSMRRQALEVIVESAFGPLRVTNTHLEYHSDEQRRAQVERLVALQLEAAEGAKPISSSPAREPYAASAQVHSAILCGDFNLGPDDPVYTLLDQPARGDASYRDAWRIAHANAPHRPTCGIFDAVQWPQGPHCRDFVFVTGDLGRSVKTVTVNEQTASSDHQPVVVEFGTRA
jgi:endonuclease/exonuclease/phosphatase family metal-dependent hydrolase